MKNICYDKNTFVITGLSDSVNYKLVNDIDSEANVTINKNAFIICCTSELKMLEVVVAISKMSIQKPSTTTQQLKVLTSSEGLINPLVTISTPYDSKRDDQLVHEYLQKQEKNVTPTSSDRLSKFKPVPDQSMTHTSVGTEDESDLMTLFDTSKSNTDIPTFPVKYAKNIHSYDSIDDNNLKRMISEYVDQDERNGVNYGYRYTHSRGQYIENNS